MVCSVGRGEMAALPRLLDAGRVSQNVTGKEISHQKLAAQYIRIEILGADEENFLDEEDVHIFGLRPMADPLDLVCCNLCKKPIKASHYVAHAELCKTILSREDVSTEQGSVVNRKPPQKERKKSTQTKKATPVIELRKLEYLNSGDIAAPKSHVDEKSRMNSSEAKCNMHLSPTPKMNGLKANPCDMHYSKDGTKVSLKSLKRTASENPSNTGTKNLCKTASEVRSYVPAPLATKIYYSQNNHHLRRAISRMFFEEPSKDVSKIQVLQVNEGPTQTSLPSNFYHEQVANQQITSHLFQAQRNDNDSRLAQIPDQIIAARSDCPVGTSRGLVSSMNTASQLPVNDALGSHHSSNSHSFAGKSGNTLGTLQQGKGSVLVL